MFEVKTALTAGLLSENRFMGSCCGNPKVDFRVSRQSANDLSTFAESSSGARHEPLCTWFTRPRSGNFFR